MAKFLGHIECAARFDRETRQLKDPITSRILRVNLHARFDTMEEAQEYMNARPKNIGLTMDRFNPIVMFNIGVAYDQEGNVKRSVINRIRSFLKSCEVDDSSPEFNKYGLAVASLDDLKKFVNA